MFLRQTFIKFWGLFVLQGDRQQTFIDFRLTNKPSSDLRLQYVQSVSFVTSSERVGVFLAVTYLGACANLTYSVLFCIHG